MVILDEIHCLIDKKKNDQRADQDTAVALWQLIDDCSDNKNILFIGTTNSIKNMPEALQSRFSNCVVEVELPNQALRETIVEFYLGNNNSDDRFIKTIAARMQGYSAREIKELVREMVAHAIQKDSYSYPTLDDFKKARADILRNRNLFKASWQENLVEYGKNNALSLAGLSISLAGLTMQYIQYQSRFGV